MARKRALQTVSQPTNLSVVNNKLKIKIDDLYQIEPLTDNQQKFFQLYKESLQIKRFLSKPMNHKL